MVRPSPAAAKTERLLNLVIALLYTRQPMTKSRIRAAVPPYQDGSDEAFDRMFERDKDELRELGIPLRTEIVDPLFDDEVGYRIDQREYRLPQIDFTPDEVAVIGLAARAWSQASLAGPAAAALRKLSAAGVERDETGVAGIEPLLHTTEPAFEGVRDAVLTRTPIAFEHRSGGGGTVRRRQVHPWALTSWHGRWYLTGHDLTREAPRVFRLDRIEGQVVPTGRPGGYAVPAEHDARGMITASHGDTEQVRARVAVRRETGQSLRRRAVETRPGEAGWDVLVLEGPSRSGLVADVAALGPDAYVVEPVELATAVRAHLRAVLAAQGES